MRALPVERPVMAGHRLQDQVVRLPEALHQFGRVGVGRRDFERHAFDKAHLDAAARDDVEHRIFLGNADRVVAVADRHAEREQPHFLGFARQDRHRDRADRVAAGHGRVVLVDHDVDAELVAQRPFVEIAMVEIGADFRVVEAARDDDPIGFVELRPGRMVGHLAEMPDFHQRTSARANALDRIGHHIGPLDLRIMPAPRGSRSKRASGSDVAELVGHNRA